MNIYQVCVSNEWNFFSIMMPCFACFFNYCFVAVPILLMLLFLLLENAAE